MAVIRDYDGRKNILDILSIKTVRPKSFPFFFFVVLLNYFLDFCTLYHNYLVRVVEEVNRDAERQRVVIGIPQQNRQNLHTARPGLPLALLLGPLQRALAVDSILPHLGPVGDRGHVKVKYIPVSSRIQSFCTSRLKFWFSGL